MEKDIFTEALEKSHSREGILGSISEPLHDFLEKGRKAQIGEIREWKGQKFQKQSNGGWTPVKMNRTPKDGGGDEKEVSLEDISNDIVEKEREISKEEEMKSTYKDTLESFEKDSEEHQNLKQKIEDADIKINNLKVDIEKEKKIEKEAKESKIEFHFTKKELERQFGFKFGLGEYDRKGTSANQNQDREE